MELDAVSDGEAMPAERNVAIVRDRFVRSRAESRSESQRNPPLQRVACDIPHLSLDCIEALSFALPDLDGQKLKQVAISVGRAGAGSFRSV